MQGRQHAQWLGGDAAHVWMVTVWVKDDEAVCRSLHAP